MRLKKLPYREGKNIVIFDARLVRQKPRSILGITCLTLSLVGLLTLFTPILAAELHQRFYRLGLLSGNQPVNPSGFGQLLELNKQGILSPADWNFSLIIPKIGVNAKITANVDLSSTKEIKQALKTGIAHAKGTSLPDKTGTIYLFGHSTDYFWNIPLYNSWLYSLKDINPKDQITVVFNNQLSHWEVKDKKIVRATDLEYLLASKDGQQLILQTCWPPGTTLKRLIVIAKPLST
jgi:sortase A